MLFDPKPKEKKNDLYNYDRELNLIVRELRDPKTPLIVIKGLRRTGKSSILRVALNEAKLNYVLVDFREFEEIDRRTFFFEFSGVLEASLRRKTSIRGIIKAVSFMGMKVEFEKESKHDSAVRYIHILRKINKWAQRRGTYFVLALDEAQEMTKINFDKYLAFVYDNLDRIKIILTGSQIGLLNNILENPDRPLFGRARIDIETKYLNREHSVKFLKKGFNEVNIDIDQKAIHKAITSFNGVIGWLTLFGWYVSKGTEVEDAIEKVKELGIKLVKKELELFLLSRGTGRKRYIEVLKILTQGPKRWKEVKTILELRLNRKIANNQVTKYLKELVKYGFIQRKENKYFIPDPMLIKTIIEKY